LAEIKSDICIVGAGLIGSALALWLAKHTDYTITLIERSPPLARPQQSNERVVALGALATDFLDDIGVLKKLGRDHCYDYQKMLVWDENSDGQLCFEASRVGLDCLGHMIDSQMCSYLLQQAISSTRIKCHFNVQSHNVDLSGSTALLDTEIAKVQSKLLIAADGSRSWVRQQAKIFANHQSYDQQGIVVKIETEKSHQDCAWQCFLSTGPVGILPLSNNQSSIVWSADNRFAKKLLAMPEEDFARTLTQALQGRLGSIKLVTKRQAFPLASLRAERYFRRNLALLGDAAHAIHPLAGQGANLGFKDALVLGKLLAGANLAELGSPRLLSRYQTKRQPDNNQTDSLMSALHQAYKFDLPVWMLIRGLGMNFLNGSDVLRNALARQAMGL